MNECTAPGAIEAWELEAFIDGTARPAVVQHVAACPACAAEVAALRSLAQRLQQALPRADCPPADDLRRYRWAELARGAAGAIHRHLASCAACRTELEGMPGPEPGRPERLRDRLAAPFLLLLATPLLPAATPALRGTAGSQTLYAVPGRPWEITLTQEAGAHGYLLLGQVFGLEPDELSTAECGLLRDDRLVAGAPLDPTGWFSVGPVASGDYTLWIEIAGEHVRIAGLAVGLQAR